MRCMFQDTGILDVNSLNFHQSADTPYRLVAFNATSNRNGNEGLVCEPVVGQR